MERVTKEPTPDAVKNLNDRMWTRSVRTVVEPHVAKHDYLVGDAFSCADIVVGWSLNWGRRDGLLDDDARRCRPAGHTRLSGAAARARALRAQQGVTRGPCRKELAFVLYYY